MLSTTLFWSFWSNMFQKTNIWNRWLKRNAKQDGKQILMQKSNDEKRKSTVAADAGSINPIEKNDLPSMDFEKKQSRNRTELQEPRQYKKTEQKEEKSNTTNTNQDLHLVKEFISLRTVPMVLSNDKVRMTENAFLDNASTKHISIANWLSI